MIQLVLLGLSQKKEHENDEFIENISINVKDIGSFQLEMIQVAI